MNLWSPYSRSRYTLESVGGKSIGLGANPMMQMVGMWNLLWISSDVVDKCLDYEGDPGNIICWCEYLPYVVGTGLQYVGELKVSQMAEQYTAQEFYDIMNKVDCSKLILPKMIGGDYWFEIMKERIESAKNVEVIPGGPVADILPFKKKGAV